MRSLRTRRDGMFAKADRGRVVHHHTIQRFDNVEVGSKLDDASHVRKKVGFAMGPEIGHLQILLRKFGEVVDTVVRDWYRPSGKGRIAASIAY
jgi:hypothetical protein